MRRQLVDLDEVMAWTTLTWAFWRAARGKRMRADVNAFEGDLPARLDRLRREVLSGHYRPEPSRAFRIRDPKPRTIRAPSFRDRVLHHALMAFVGPVLERSLVADTFACRAGKGTLAAVRRAQQHARHHGWYVKVDFPAYFDSIDHERLLDGVARRIRGRRALRLLERIVVDGATRDGAGLPIGALTSQHLANFFLSPFDHAMLQQESVGGMVRYMDDVVWWTNSVREARATLRNARELLRDRLGLDFKPSVVVQRSRLGLSLCGFRVSPHAIRLSRRRQQRYSRARARWEVDYRRGLIRADQLQLGYDSALAVTAHAEAADWRRSELVRRGSLDA